THTELSPASSSDNTVWPWVLSMSARPRRMLGRLAKTTTMAIFYMAMAALLPGADSQAELAQLAAPNNRRAHAAANSVRPEQPLQIVGIGHRGAIQSNEDIALQETRGRGRSALGNLDHEQ